MQEKSLVMWRNFDQFDPDRPGSKFIDWAFMIARYEILRYRRKRAWVDPAKWNASMAFHFFRRLEANATKI